MLEHFCLQHFWTYLIRLCMEIIQKYTHLSRTKANTILQPSFHTGFHIEKSSIHSNFSLSKIMEHCLSLPIILIIIYLLILLINKLNCFALVIRPRKVYAFSRYSINSHCVESHFIVTYIGWHISKMSKMLVHIFWQFWILTQKIDFWINIPLSTSYYLI